MSRIADQPVPSTPATTTPGRSAGSQTRRVSRTARQVGYGVAAGINVLLLYLVNVAPGWEVLPFLTDDVTAVLGLLNASLVVAAVVNLIWVLADPPWLRALGQVVQSGFGLAVVVSLLDVFPFDVAVNDTDLAWLLRFVLVVVAIATAIGMLVQLATLVRVAVRSGRG